MWEVIFHWGFGLHFPYDYWYWVSSHVLAGHLHMSSGKMPLQDLCPFFKKVFLLVVAFWGWIAWVLCVFWISTPDQANCLQISPPTQLAAFLFCWYCPSLCETSAVWCSPACVFTFVSLAWGDTPIKYCWDGCQGAHCLFSSRVLWVQVSHLSI